ncbi:MAG: hypothetical protein AUJ98_08795 [Bacteroidetes bacterium CG2_30_33_31]|nr:MAG: hypothetical protein AUJ98_08795 [Bacteroidetes bacterium CG2_30_33_31]
MKPKILFASPIGPYTKLALKEDPIDFFYYRNTFGQKMFQLRSFQSWHSLHFLAQNIAVDSVVLENPTMKIFQKEIHNGEYEIIAIGFTILLTKKVLEMVEWIKLNFPAIEIVIGGYGTAVFTESFETSDKLKNMVNYISYGEGLELMNSIIKHKWNINNNNKVLRQDLLPAKNSFFRTHIEIFQQIVLVGGLGCVFGCSFCATSSQFNKKYIPLFTGKQLFDSLCEQRKKHPTIKSAIIYDEDFLLNRRQVLEFIECFKNSELQNSGMLLTIFASLKSLLNFSREELIDCGVGSIFIGVESLSEEVLKREGLTKRKGEVEDIFRQLHSYGINTIGSLIIGWDSQNLMLAKSDSERFINMNPTFYQVVPLHIVPGTKLWDEMKLAERVLPNYKVEFDGITDFNFEAKSFSHHEARDLVFKTYDGLVKEGGPWPFRFFENLLYGYLNLKEKNEANLFNRAKIYKSMLPATFILAFASRYFFFGKNYRYRWNQSMRKFIKHSPMLFFLGTVISPFVAFLLLVIWFYGNIKFLFSRKGDQPDFIRREYFS